MVKKVNKLITLVDFTKSSAKTAVMYNYTSVYKCFLLGVGASAAPQPPPISPPGGLAIEEFAWICLPMYK